MWNDISFAQCQTSEISRRYVSTSCWPIYWYEFWRAMQASFYKHVFFESGTSSFKMSLILFFLYKLALLMILSFENTYGRRFWGQTCAFLFLRSSIVFYRVNKTLEIQGNITVNLTVLRETNLFLWFIDFLLPHIKSCSSFLPHQTQWNVTTSKQRRSVFISNVSDDQNCEIYTQVEMQQIYFWK